MKLIIIEGTDNTGKNTLIYNLLECANNVKIEHCTKPKATTVREAQVEQQSFFNCLAFNDALEYNHNFTNIVIHNRSFYGEYVYGCMYRGNSDEWVKNLVSSLEAFYKANINEDDIYFITLLAKNPEFLKKNDDGLSLSDAKVEKIKEETQRFKDIFEFSTFKNKKIIYVDENGEFRKREDIWNEVKTFVGL